MIYPSQITFSGNVQTSLNRLMKITISDYLGNVYERYALSFEVMILHGGYSRFFTTPKWHSFINVRFDIILNDAARAGEVWDLFIRREMNKYGATYFSGGAHDLQLAYEQLYQICGIPNMHRSLFTQVNAGNINSRFPTSNLRIPAIFAPCHYPQEITMYPTQSSMDNNAVLHAISPLKIINSSGPESIRKVLPAVVIDGTDESICALIYHLNNNSSQVAVLLPISGETVASSYYTNFVTTVCEILETNNTTNKLPNHALAFGAILGNLEGGDFVNLSGWRFDSSEFANYKTVIIGASELASVDNVYYMPIFGISNTFAEVGALRSICTSINSACKVMTITPDDIAKAQLTNLDLWETVRELQTALIGIHYGFITTPYVEPVITPAVEVVKPAPRRNTKATKPKVK